MEHFKILSIIIGAILLVGCKNTNVDITSAKLKKIKCVKSDQCQYKEFKSEQEIEEIISKITKEEAVKIALKGFESYFNKKVTIKNLEEKIIFSPIKDSKEIFWFLNWGDEQALRIKGSTGRVYSAIINSESGEVLNLRYYNRDIKGRFSGIDYKEARIIALNFIKKHELIDGEIIEFLKDDREKISSKSSQYFTLYFKDNNDKTIIITFDKIKNEVCGFLVHI